MPEDVANHFAFSNFAAPVSGTLREILDNDTTTRDKISLKVLDVTKGESVGVSTMLKILMKVAQEYTVFNYVPPKSQNNVNS